MSPNPVMDTAPVKPLTLVTGAEAGAWLTQVDPLEVSTLPEELGATA